VSRKDDPQGSCPTRQSRRQGAPARWRNESRSRRADSHTPASSGLRLRRVGIGAYLRRWSACRHRLSDYLDRGIRFGRGGRGQRSSLSLGRAAARARARRAPRRRQPGEHPPSRGAGDAKIADFGCAPTEDGGSPGARRGGARPRIHRAGVTPVRRSTRAPTSSPPARCSSVDHGSPAYPGSAEQVAYRVSRGSTPQPSQADAGRGWERYDDVVSRAAGQGSRRALQTASEFRHALLDALRRAAGGGIGDVLIKEPSPPGNLGRTGRSAVAPARPPDAFALEEAQIQAQLTEDPFGLHAIPPMGAGVLPLSLQSSLSPSPSSLCSRTGPRPNSLSKVRGPTARAAPAPDATTAGPRLRPSARLDPTQRDKTRRARRSPVRPPGASAQSRKPIAARWRAVPHPARRASRAEAQSTPPAPAAIEPPSAQDVVPAVQQVAARRGPRHP